MLPPRNQPLGGKYVGAGGALLTPEQAAQQKQIAAALLEQASDTSPVGHWTAALNRGLQGWLGGRDMYNARQAEREGREGALERFNKRLSGNGAVDAVASALSMGDEVPVDTLSLLREFEGFRDTPYWDVNAHRTGYGSDTVTLADGSVIPVTPDMKITREDAERDLQRRVQTEFMPRAVSAVGEDVWGALSEPQRAALTSITYNYGRLPSSVARAVASGDVNAASQAIAALGSHNNGVNAKRRQREASIFAGAGAGTSQAPRAGNVSQIAALLADPWMPQEAKAVLQAEMNQQMQMQNAAYKMQLQQQDPMRQLQMQQAQLGNQRAALELEQLRNPAPVIPEAPETQVFYDEATGQEYRAQWNPASMSWDRIGGVKAPSAPLVQNTIGGGESEFNKEVGKNQAATFNEMSASGFTAAQNLGNLDRLESLLSQGPSGASAALQNLAANYGIDVGNAGPLQAASALINAMIPGQRPAGSGPMSDRDVDMFKASLPRLINSSEGNALVIQTLRGIAQYDLQRAEIADRAMLPESDPMHLPRNEAAKALRQLRSPLSDFGKAASQFEAPKADATAVPQGVDPADWEFMTEEEKALFQ